MTKHYLYLKHRVLLAVAAAALTFQAPAFAGQTAEKEAGKGPEKELDYQVPLPAAPKGPITFTPPGEDEIPKGPFGDMVRYGRDLFINTDQLRGKYVGNGMRCVNCHLDAGRKAGSAPLWAAYVVYPAYRKKNDKVNTLEERIQGCFQFSMNGTPPPSGSKELTALITYHYWLATGAPVGKELAGRGFPKLAKAAQAPDTARGKQVYEANCAICHGANGQGQQVDGKYVFPPLWGNDSYNWGAGMHRIDTAAEFIKANMPLAQGNTLSDQDAWDVAKYINSHPRPADPRFIGSLEETDKVFHDENCTYGDHVNGHRLGEPGQANKSGKPKG